MPIETQNSIQTNQAEGGNIGRREHKVNFNHRYYRTLKNYKGRDPSLMTRLLNPAFSYLDQKARKHPTSRSLQKKTFKLIESLQAKGVNATKALDGNEALQGLLSKEIRKLQQRETKNPELQDDRDHRLDKTIAVTSLIQKLGGKAFEQTDAGENGAQFALDFAGRKRGVFKPKPQQLGIFGRIKRWFKNMFGQRSYCNQAEGAEQVNEVARRYLSDALGTDDAPKAKEVAIGNLKGAFIEFIPLKPLSEVKHHIERRGDFEEAEKTIWQKACLSDFIAGNMDAHFENIFVKLDSNRQIKKVVFIDAGNAFIRENPGYQD